MALCSSSCSTFSVKSSLLSQKPSIFAWSKRHLSFRLTRATDNVAEVVGSTAVEKKIEAKEESSPPVLEKKEEPKGAVATTAVPNFKNPRWVGGTWDLTQFAKDGKTDWDAIIDAEARRRKCKQFL